MTGIYSIAQSTVTSISHVLKESYPLAEWAGRVVKVIRNLPYEMQNHRNVAITVFTTTNVVCFTIANQFANWLDRRIESHPEELTHDQKIFKGILLNGFVISSSAFTYNFILSKATKYPLSKVVFVAIIVTSIATRILLSYVPMQNTGQFKDQENIQIKKGKKRYKSSQDQLDDLINDGIKALEKKKAAAEKEAIAQK